jgi:hypothetical protein
MPLDATLRVKRAQTGQVLTYGNAQIAQEDLVSQNRFSSDGLIEKDSLEVSFLSPTFLGFQSLEALPEGSLGDPLRHRCEIVMDGETILDGSVKKTGVSTDPPDENGQRAWTVRVEADAMDRVLSYLASVRLLDRPLTNHYDNEDTYRRLPTSVADVTAESTGEPTRDTFRWYSIEELWRETVREGGFTFERTIPLFPVTFRYAATDITTQTKTINARVSLCSLDDADINDGGDIFIIDSLPDISGKALYDLVTQLTGLRVRARYEPFPSEEVKLYEIEGAWDSERSLTLPDLTERQQNDTRYDLSTEEPEKPGFAVAYANVPGASTNTNVPRVAAYASQSPLLDQEGKPVGDGVLKVDASLALWRGYGLDEVAIGDQPPRMYQHSDGYEEELYEAIPYIKKDGTYIASVSPVKNEADDGSSRRQILAMRYPESTGGLDPPPEPRGGSWAAVQHPRHTIRAARLHQITLDVGLPEGSELAVGEPRGGFEVAGERYLTRDLQVNADKGSARVEGVRPTKTYDAEIALPESLYGELDQVDFDWRQNSDDTYDVIIYVRSVPPDKILPFTYAYEMYENRNGDLILSGSGVTPEYAETYSSYPNAFYIVAAENTNDSSVEDINLAQVRGRYGFGDGVYTDWLEGDRANLFQGPNDHQLPI